MQGPAVGSGHRQHRHDPGRRQQQQRDQRGCPQPRARAIGGGPELPVAQRRRVCRPIRGRARAVRTSSDRLNRQPDRVALEAGDERPDRGRLRGARRPLRARRRVQYRVIAYRTAAQDGARRLRLRRAARARRARRRSCRASARRSRRSSTALIETGDIPAAAEAARASSRPALIAMMHLPGFGPKRARRLYDELGIDSLDGAARRRRAAAAARPARASARRSRRSCSRRSPPAPTGDRRRACCSSRALPIAEQIVDALRGAPGAERVEVAGSLRRQADSVKDLDVIATAADPAALVADARPSCRSSSPSHSSGDAGARGSRTLGHEGRPQGRRARPVRQRAAALHGLQGAQRRAARGGGASAACTSRSTGSSTTRPARRCAARPRRRSTSGSGCRGSRRSCARAAASSRRPRRARLPELVTLDDLRGDLHCHTTLSDGRQDARGDGRGRARRAATSTSRSPTTPPRTASATTSTPTRCARRSSASARWTRELDDFTVLIGTETNVLPGRLARLRRRRCSPSSTG